MGSFPNIVYLKDADVRTASTKRNGGLSLGQQVVLPDGTEYIYGRVGGTALVAGRLYEGEAYASGTGNIKSIAVIAGSAQKGDTVISVTMSATGAMAKDQYADGYIFTSAATGGGTSYKYRVKTCASAAAGSTAVIGLYEPIVETIAGGTTAVGLRVNPYFNCKATSGDTVGINSLAGVSCATAAASSYCFFQTRGPASVLTDNTTLIVGLPVMASSTVAGAVGLAAGTVVASRGYATIGYCMSVAASAEFSLVDLAIK